MLTTTPTKKIINNPTTITADIAERTSIDDDTSPIEQDTELDAPTKTTELHHELKKPSFKNHLLDKIKRRGYSSPSDKLMSPCSKALNAKHL